MAEDVVSERGRFCCPACGTLSEMIVGPTQAFCTNVDDCAVFTFNPSLPDGGASDPQVIDTSGWVPQPDDGTGDHCSCHGYRRTTGACEQATAEERSQ